MQYVQDSRIKGEGEKERQRAWMVGSLHGLLVRNREREQRRKPSTYAKAPCRYAGRAAKFEFPGIKAMDIKV